MDRWGIEEPSGEEAVGHEARMVATNNTALTRATSCSEHNARELLKHAKEQGNERNSQGIQEHTGPIDDMEAGLIRPLAPQI